MVPLQPAWYRLYPRIPIPQRGEHKSWDGLILPKEDPWWDSHFPPNGWNCRCHTRAVSKARLKRYQAKGIPLPPRVDGSGGGTLRVKTVTPEVRYKTYINKRTGKVEQVPEGVDPAFNWHVGKASRGGMGEQALEGARNRYAKTTTGQGIQRRFDQALSATPGPHPPLMKNLFSLPVSKGMSG